jgi:hypothetical protein
VAPTAAAEVARVENKTASVAEQQKTIERSVAEVRTAPVAKPAKPVHPVALGSPSLDVSVRPLAAASPWPTQSLGHLAWADREMTRWNAGVETPVVAPSTIAMPVIAPVEPPSISAVRTAPRTETPTAEARAQAIQSRPVAPMPVVASSPAPTAVVSVASSPAPTAVGSVTEARPARRSVEAVVMPPPAVMPVMALHPQLAWSPIARPAASIATSAQIADQPIASSGTAREIAQPARYTQVSQPIGWASPTAEFIARRPGVRALVDATPVVPTATIARSDAWTPQVPAPTVFVEAGWSERPAATPTRSSAAAPAPVSALPITRTTENRPEATAPKAQPANATASAPSAPTTRKVEAATAPSLPAVAPTADKARAAEPTHARPGVTASRSEQLAQRAIARSADLSFDFVDLSLLSTAREAGLPANRLPGLTRLSAEGASPVRLAAALGGATGALEYVLQRMAPAATVAPASDGSRPRSTVSLPMVAAEPLRVTEAAQTTRPSVASAQPVATQGATQVGPASQPAPAAPVATSRPRGSVTWPRAVEGAFGLVGEKQTDRATELLTRSVLEMATWAGSLGAAIRRVDPNTSLALASAAVDLRSLVAPEVVAQIVSTMKPLAALQASEAAKTVVSRSSEPRVETAPSSTGAAEAAATELPMIDGGVDRGTATGAVPGRATAAVPGASTSPLGGGSRPLVSLSGAPEPVRSGASAPAISAAPAARVDRRGAALTMLVGGAASRVGTGSPDRTAPVLRALRSAEASPLRAALRAVVAPTAPAAPTSGESAPAVSSRAATAPEAPAPIVSPAQPAAVDTRPQPQGVPAEIAALLGKPAAALAELVRAREDRKADKPQPAAPSALLPRWMQDVASRFREISSTSDRISLADLALVQTAMVSPEGRVAARGEASHEHNRPRAQQEGAPGAGGSTVSDKKSNEQIELIAREVFTRVQKLLRIGLERSGDL